jgi:excinuclease ABC subunit C
VRGPTSPLTLIVKMRDEAHRFAVDYHRKVRSKASLGSRLTDIPHVGPATARKLLRALGSLKRIRAASEQDLIEAGASRRAAASIRAHLSTDRRR